MSTSVLSNLFALTYFSGMTPSTIVTPFNTNYTSVVCRPCQRRLSKAGQTMLKSFSPSTHGYVGPSLLSFTVPFGGFGDVISRVRRDFLGATA